MLRTFFFFFFLCVLPTTVLGFKDRVVRYVVIGSGSFVCSFVKKKMVGFFLWGGCFLVVVLFWVLFRGRGQGGDKNSLYSVSLNQVPFTTLFIVAMNRALGVDGSQGINNNIYTIMIIRCRP